MSEQNKPREWTLCHNTNFDNRPPDVISGPEISGYEMEVDVIEKSAYDAILALTIGMAAVLEHAIDLEYFVQGGSTEAWAKDELAKFNKFKETLNAERKES